jgi:hypothetical protein
LVAYDHWDLIHLLADQLGAVEGVTRVDMPGRPSLLLVRGATPRTAPLRRHPPAAPSIAASG